MNPAPAILCHISLGSNLPGAAGHAAVAAALGWLAEAIAASAPAMQSSGIYTTPAAGHAAAADPAAATYHNAVARLATTLTADALARRLRTYETTHGRRRPSPLVAIDLDLVQYGPRTLRPADALRPYYLAGLRRLPPADL